MDVYFIRCFVNQDIISNSIFWLAITSVRETHLDGIGGEVQDAERRRLREGVRVQRRDQVVAQVQD